MQFVIDCHNVFAYKIDSRLFLCCYFYVDVFLPSVHSDNASYTVYTAQRYVHSFFSSVTY